MRVNLTQTAFAASYCQAIAVMFPRGGRPCHPARSRTAKARQAKYQKRPSWPQILPYGRVKLELALCARKTLRRPRLRPPTSSPAMAYCFRVTDCPAVSNANVLGGDGGNMHNLNATAAVAPRHPQLRQRRPLPPILKRQRRFQMNLKLTQVSHKGFHIFCMCVFSFCYCINI